jgi:hypothetical protein
VENGQIVATTINKFWKRSFSDIKHLCDVPGVDLKFVQKIEVTSKAVSSK